MADVKISQLPAAVNLQGADVAPFVSGGITVKATAAQVVVAGLNTTPATIAQGGTNATTAAGARTNLGLGTVATQNANNVAFTGGAIESVTVGASVPDTGAFTSLAYNTTLTGGTGIIAIGTNQIYKDALGNVGIGTSTPVINTGVNSLTVDGSSTYGSGIQLRQNGIPAMTLLANASSTALAAAGTLSFITNGTPWLQIASGGEFLVNTSAGTAGQVLSSNGAASPASWLTLGSMSAQSASNVAITGGAINGTTIGATTASTGAFTTASASTSLTTPALIATAASTGISIENNAGTVMASFGTGSSSHNVTISPANGTVTISPTGSLASVVINSGGGGTLDGLTIGSVNPANATINTLTVNTSAGLAAGTVTAAPVNPTDITNKLYVDTVAQGLSIKAASECATTADLGTVTYNNGTAGVGATLTGTAVALVIDGYTVLLGNRVLVKNEATPAYNGIYTLTTLGTVSVPWVLTRAVDSNTWADIYGEFTFVQNGTVNANTGWAATVPATGTIGSTPITYAQFSGAGTYLAGTGLTLTGNTFSISNTAVTAGTYGSASQYNTFTINAQGQVTAASAGDIAISNTQVSGLGTMSTQNASNVTITGGTMNGVIIGGSNPVAGTFTTLGAATSFSTAVILPKNASGIQLQNVGGTANLITVGASSTNNVSITATGTGVVSITSGAIGSMDNVLIGNTTPVSGTFTNLAANTKLITGLLQASGTGGLTINNSSLAAVATFGGSSNTTTLSDGTIAISGQLQVSNVTTVSPIVINSSGANGTSLSIGMADASGQALFAASNTLGAGYFNFLVGNGTAEGMSINENGDIILRAGSATATSGWFWIPGGVGAPTAAPDASNTGRYANATPLQWDDKDNILWAYRRQGAYWTGVPMFDAANASLYTATGVGGSPTTFTFLADSVSQNFGFASTAVLHYATAVPALATMTLPNGGTYQMNMVVNFQTPNNSESSANDNDYTYYFWIADVTDGYPGVPYANTFTSGSNVPLPDYTYSLPLAAEAQVFVQPGATLAVLCECVYGSGQTGSTGIKILNANMSLIQLNQRTA